MIVGYLVLQLLKDFLTPHVGRVPLLRLHLLDVLLSLVVAHVPLCFDYVEQNVSNIRRHIFGISENGQEIKYFGQMT